jgi:hypothetical protein
LPGVLTAQGCNLVLSLDEKRIDLLSVIKKNPSGRRQSDVRPSAIKELNAKILLKRLDLETHGGLREIQLFSGLAEAELFRYCPEDHETEIFEAGHSIIRTLARGGLREHRSRTGMHRCGISVLGQAGSAIANSILIPVGLKRVLCIRRSLPVPIWRDPTIRLIPLRFSIHEGCTPFFRIGFPVCSGIWCISSEQIAKRNLLYSRLCEGSVIHTEFSAGCYVLQ